MESVMEHHKLKSFKKKVLAASLIGAIVTTTGCVSGVTKEQVGSGLGAITGALLGSQVGSGDGRKLAILVGGLAGAYLGGEIGRRLDENDRLAATQALENLNDRQSTTYSNPTTGKTTTFTVNNTQTVVKDVPIVRKKSVAPAPSMALIGKEYQAIKSANVRNAPTTSGSTVLSGLTQGEHFTAVGRVSNKPWIMVAKNDVTVGYVHSSLVKEASQSKGIILREAVDLDALDSHVKNNYQAVNLDEELVVENTKVQTSCRNVTYSQQDSQDTFKACKGADGAWEIS